MNIGKEGIFLIGLVLGFAVGCFVTDTIYKDKFDKKLGEELSKINPEIEENTKPKKDEEVEADVVENGIGKSSIHAFGDSITEDGMIDYNHISSVIGSLEDNKEEVENLENIRIISDTEFNDPRYESYKQIQVSYYKNGVVVEEPLGEPIEDFELVAGTAWRNRFGEYSVDTVYVRNDKIRTDFEIIRDEEEYEDPPYERG